VIFALAFYVVQWQAGVTVKMLAVVLASFVVSMGIYELIVPAGGSAAGAVRHEAAARPPHRQTLAHGNICLGQPPARPT